MLLESAAQRRAALAHSRRVARPHGTEPLARPPACGVPPPARTIRTELDQTGGDSIPRTKTHSWATRLPARTR
jgi:hypothetical protein